MCIRDSDRSYKVKINDSLSDAQSLAFGVPQGSILGPILYSLYVKDIEKIAENYSIKVHIYADDVQLYTSCNKNSDFSDLANCLEEIKEWANRNYLKLNDNKTQLLCVSKKSYSSPLPTYLKLMGQTLKVENCAKYLGVWLDSRLSISRQINSVCSQGYIMLKNLWRISSKISSICIRTQLIDSCILSRLNFCNALYFNLPNKELYKLQKLLNAGARFIFNIYGKRRQQSITSFLQKLHFLPIKFRVDFKVCLMVYKCLNNQAPEYLKCMLLSQNIDCDKRTRQDYDRTGLRIPPVEKLRYKCRSFRYAAPVVWNRLPRSIRESVCIDTFKTRLKTFYFNEWLAD